VPFDVTTSSAVPRVAACGPEGAVVELLALAVSVGAAVGAGPEQAATAATAAKSNAIMRDAAVVVMPGY